MSGPRPWRPRANRGALLAARVVGGVSAASAKLCAALRLGAGVMAVSLASASIAHAQTTVAAASPASTPIPQSALDAALMYQLLIGEIQLSSGDPGSAYEVILDAARRTRDEGLFRRATEIALQSRAPEQALTAIRAWRQAVPGSIEPIRSQAQLLIAMNRVADTVEPLRALITATPADQRSALIAIVPRFYGRVADPRSVVPVVEQIVAPWADTADTRVAARVAVARAWFGARDTARALELAARAHALDPRHEAPPLLAIDIGVGLPAAESIVKSHLAAQPQSLPVRLNYARALAASQRYGEAIPQLEAVTTAQPELAPPWLTLGAMHLELRHPVEATVALKRYLDALNPEASRNAASASGSTAPERDEDDADDEPPETGRTSALLMLAQAAEMQGRFGEAETWLGQIDSAQNALEVQTRRASMLARQGKVREARESIQRAPERGPTDRRAKLLAEAQVLRDVKQWAPAWDVLATANQQFPDDTDLLYEQSMVAEKLDRLPEMERLLRRVIELRPDHHHAYNALGYSLADRNLRLTEARDLIRKALELAPGEPFITDSLGWVEFRLGNRDEALRLLRQAWRARPDPEIGAHLGEVLWSAGQRDEAREIWRQSRQRDENNDVLRETLRRLKVDL